MTPRHCSGAAFTAQLCISFVESGIAASLEAAYDRKHLCELNVSIVTASPDAVYYGYRSRCAAGNTALERVVTPCREAEAGGFWAYVAGTAHKIATEHMVRLTPAAWARPSAMMSTT